MRTGRPRGFDVDSAVEAALALFIEKGYEGAALGELTSAMGINPPSLYAAFGSKEGLFLRAVEVYSDRVTASMTGSLGAATAYEALAAMTHSAADFYTEPSKPPGCLLVQGGLTAGDRAQPARAELAKRREANRGLVRQRLERAALEGDTSVVGDPAVIALYVSTVTNGIAVMAADGATREQLHDTVDTALLSLKGPLPG
ncbi:TetR/AcrR family transcriptional regulator [Umezawaea sp. NPDC059074]|uniref:TetR/AcrR family transcriptional regulator n=1 Tax=Umezawaea sp. NPDC059074 TaxID=3346716 RepID=UPI0036A58095